MMQTEYSPCLLELIRQHEEIKLTSTLALDLLHAWAEEGDSTHLDELRRQILRFCQLCIDHFKHEEEILFPLFKEMYETNEEISKFVTNEHSHLNDQFSILAKLIVDANRPTDEFVKFVSGILNSQLEHKFMEEQALYPLVQTHLNRKH